MYPWLLGHVCSRWRTSLWSASSFWSSIQINIFPCPSFRSTPVLGSRQCDIAQTALCHILDNTDSLLSLSVQDTKGAIFTDIILSQLRRFRTLHWETTMKAFSSLFDLPRHSFEYLEELDICWPLDPHLEFPLSVASALCTAPRFHSMTVTSVRSPYYIPQLLCLPWEQMTKVSVYCQQVSPTFIYAALQNCPVLTSCLFIINGDVVNPRLSMITLPHLKEFHLESSTQDFEWEIFLGPFVASSLSGLTVYSRNDCLPAFASFIIRSGCSLRSLLLGTSSSSNDAALQLLLEHTPELVNFSTPSTLSVPIIRIIGTLPLLLHGKWHVEPEGLSASLDIVNSLIPYIIFNKRFLCLTISCHADIWFPGHDRYLASYWTYQKIERLSVSVYHVGYGGIRDSDVNEPDSEDDEEGDENSSGVSSDSESGASDYTDSTDSYTIST